MIITDLGYGNGLWLDAPAANSLWRINAQIGRRLDINEAGRTWAQQNAFRQAYLNGTGSYALPPGSSIHEQGRAIDTDDRLLSVMADHGWFQTALGVGEPWHFEYDTFRDNHRNETAAGGATPFPEDDMTPEQAHALFEIRDYLGAAGGRLWPSENTIGARVIDIQHALTGALPALSASLERLERAVQNASYGAGVNGAISFDANGAAIPQIGEADNILAIVRELREQVKGLAPKA